MRINYRTFQRITILFIFIILCIILSLTTEYFFTKINLLNVLQQVTILLIAASGATFVLISGGLDLSVGSTIALSGVLSAGFAANGYPITICFLIGILGGLLVGLVNGLLVSYTKILPIIATLGTMWVVRGVAFIYTASQTEGALSIVTGIPRIFRIIGRGSIQQIPIIVIISILVLLITYVILRFTVFGLRTYAVGCSEDATSRFGVNTRIHKLIVYTLAGGLSGLAGILLASRLGSGEPNSAVGFEFDVIVAVILGGTSLRGGEGSMFGTVIGAFFIGVLSNGLNLLEVQTFYRYVVLGSILIIAVIIDTLLKRQDLKIFGKRFVPLPRK